MALKGVPILEITNLDQISTPLSVVLSSPHLTDAAGPPAKPSASFSVIGHRGYGMNFHSSVVRENSVLSFNEASRFKIPFVEFDVQVTRDGVPVVFHDVFILTRVSGSAISEHRVANLSLEEFLTYGFQRDSNRVGKPLLRRAADGQVIDWIVENDDSLCTLEEAFHRVDPRLGFNIELKFDNDFVYREEELNDALRAIVQSVEANACGRQVIFSTFHPDAARIVRLMQRDYPVYFLTNGGKVLHNDSRRNSLEEAMKLCVECELVGIVSEVMAVLRDPAMVAGIKEKNLRLLTYGQLNNTIEVVYMQHLMGIDGVIVDRVQEISEAALSFVSLQERGGEGNRGMEAGANFSEEQFFYLRKLTAELVQS